MHRIVTWKICLWLCAVTWAAGAPKHEPRCVLPAKGRRTRQELCTRVKVQKIGNNYKYQFELEGFRAQKLDIHYNESGYIHLEVICNGWAALDSAALPAFSSEFRVPHVSFRACPPPIATGSSFADALSALNVTLLHSSTWGRLTLESLPSSPPLQAQHFSGLEELVQLEFISGAYYFHSLLYDITAFDNLAPGFLSRLRNLRSLLVHYMRFPRRELERLPASLSVLILNEVGVKRLPDAVLALPGLQTLELIADNVMEFEVPQTLRHLSLESEDTIFRLKSIPQLETLLIAKWSEIHPTALARCDKLLSLELNFPAIKSLPDGWVAPCLLLKQLFISNAIGLKSIPSKLLKNATALQELSLTEGVLETLPPGLLDHVPNLRSLCLSRNRLRMLPSGILDHVRELRSLTLSENLLGAEMVELLAGLQSLERLELSFNPLTDLCKNSTDYSHLRRMKKLRYMFLYGTNITHICRDWRENLTSLEILNLGNTEISELTFTDLQYIRDVSITKTAEVILDGAPIVLIKYSEEDYNASLVAAQSGARVCLDGVSRLYCDCRMYWAGRALSRLPPSGTRVAGLRCTSGLMLSAVEPEELQCRAAALCRALRLPASCTCTARPAPQRRRLLRVHCSSAALTLVPPLPRTNDTVYDLLLANNNISHLHACDLPPLIRELDLRNNSLERVDEKTAQGAMLAGRLLLSGNPLACDCHAAPLLLALHAAGEGASDLRTATCADGSPLHAAPVYPCGTVPLATWLTAAIIALLATTAIAVLLCAARTSHRSAHVMADLNNM